jgi:hypothetical protein
VGATRAELRFGESGADGVGMRAVAFAIPGFVAAFFSFFAIVFGSEAVLVLAPLGIVLAICAAGLAVRDLRRLPPGIDRGAAIGAFLVAIPSLLFAALSVLVMLSPAN